MIISFNFFPVFLHFDHSGNVTLRAGDKVSFQIATNQRGNLGACHIRLENPVHPVKYRGVVCSMKESFGFIERADVVKGLYLQNKKKFHKFTSNLPDNLCRNILSFL